MHEYVIHAYMTLEEDGSDRSSVVLPTLVALAHILDELCYVLFALPRSLL